MYEELIYRLENAARGTEGRKVARDAADAIAALQAENGEKDREIERLKDIAGAYAESARSVALWLDAYCDRSLPYDKMISDAARKAAVTLSRVEAERDAAMQAINDMRFAYINKDADCPHRFEIEALRCADRMLEHWRGAQGEA